MLSFIVNKAHALSVSGVGIFPDLGTAINRIFQIVVWASAIAFLVLFIVGGIQYLTSAGNEEASGKAKKLLVDAVVGLLIVLIAWAAGSWVLGQLGISPGTIPSI